MGVHVEGDFLPILDKPCPFVLVSVLCSAWLEITLSEWVLLLMVSISLWMV